MITCLTSTSALAWRACSRSWRATHCSRCSACCAASSGSSTFRPQICTGCAGDSGKAVLLGLCLSMLAATALSAPPAAHHPPGPAHSARRSVQGVLWFEVKWCRFHSSFSALLQLLHVLRLLRGILRVQQVPPAYLCGQHGRGNLLHWANTGNRSERAILPGTCCLQTCAGQIRLKNRTTHERSMVSTP